MQTKKRQHESRAKVQPRVQSPPAKPPALDDRRIFIIGRNAAGKVVAEDKAAEHWKAKQIADGWRAGGLNVEIVDRG